MEKRNWDSRSQYGICRRSKLARKASGCNSIEGLMEIKKAEDCNTKVKTDSFNLDEMSTQAILAFARIKSRQLREEIFAIIKHSIINDIDPVTKKPLGYTGITEPMVRDLIELKTTGKIAPKPPKKTHLTTRDIDLLDVIKARAIAASKTNGEKEAINALYRKIVGLPQEATA